MKDRLTDEEMTRYKVVSYSTFRIAIIIGVIAGFCWGLKL